MARGRHPRGANRARASLHCRGVGGTFVNNQIPANCIDPASARILALVPHANNAVASGARNISDFAAGRSNENMLKPL